ncbi:NUDIX domain protein [Mycobacterium ulcerans str. Harvey]|uniref:8-oxo-dGTP diphosphatase n=1 Tax=Mycobacterium ulcerans str. Harvey TaxID=1299332 RepID=A0ABP3ALF3_MYCUL|nr:NUDIX domain protein [Mycobacterium ulcerans str. Harvey]
MCQFVVARHHVWLAQAGLARSQGCGGAGLGVLGQHGFGRIAVRRIWEVALPGRLGEIPSLAMPNQPNQIVVAGAFICGATVLVAQRVRPPELAGRWELPGGKVAGGETEPAALARELVEELGLGVDDVAVGERLGPTLCWMKRPYCGHTGCVCCAGTHARATTVRCAG